MVTRNAFVPDRGDAVWINLDPQAGREQSGRRPALVLSPKAYNAKVGLAIFCPITRHTKQYPFEVPIPVGSPVNGVVLSDQVKSLDWRAREAQLLARLPDDIVQEVLRRLAPLLRP